MCEVLGPTQVAVCDVAVERYRQALVSWPGTSVSFTHIDYQPTLVECHDESRLEEFGELVRELMGEGR